MKKNESTTKKVAGKGSVLVVKAGNTTDKKFDASNAQEIKPVTEPIAEEKTQETQAVETSPTTTNVQENKEQIVHVNQQEKRKEPTLQEFKDRATILFLLQEKHTKLLEKKNRLEHFTVSHDSFNAEIIIKDANGEEFRSTSPKTIGQFIEFCKAEFSTLITETETNLIKAFAV